MCGVGIPQIGPESTLGTAMAHVGIVNYWYWTSFTYVPIYLTLLEPVLWVDPGTWREEMEDEKKIQNRFFET